MNFPHIYYGGDYNPEQWGPETWEEDARLMQEAGVNLVSLGVFSWSKIEPEAGRYNFSWLDHVMDLLHKHGVSINLATPTASPPPWLVLSNPEILPVTIDGKKLWYGSRRHYCPHSPAFHERAKLLVTKLAEHVRGHPALTLWHVDNELACHISECFCDVSIGQFRAWLQQRYESLDKLNEAWGTNFWSQHYSQWEEVTAPLRTPASVNPSQHLDWLRFCSDSWVDVFTEQKKILKTITPDIPVTTNFMGFFKPLDYWTLAAQEDVVSNDSYPDPSDPDWMIYSGMMCDLVRSLRNGEPWLLMEQAPAQVNWRARNATKRPGIMRLGSYQALGRGGNGIMFFQWRASQSGSEKFHSAMLPHAGPASRTWREVKVLGTELGKLDALLSSRVRSEVGILFDWHNWWALEQSDKPSNELRLLPQLKALYAEFFRRNIPVDFIQAEADLSPYKLIVAPHLYLTSKAAGANIERYVAGGGTLFMTYFSGIVDRNDRVLLGGYPAAFRRTLGLWIEEFVVYMQSQSNTVITFDEQLYNCSQWSDIIHLEGAEALGHYQDDFFAGEPAVTRHQFGRGFSYYLGTELAPEGLSWLYDRICIDANVRPALSAPPRVEVTCRTDGAHTWLFALNHSDAHVNVRLPSQGVDLFSGASVNTLEMEPKGVAVIQLEGQV